MSDSVKQLFQQLLAERQMTVTNRQLEQFELYWQELVSWNEKMNLTGITEREQVYVKHFYDSLSLSFFVPLNDVRTVADIGSGAGFPSLPLLILYPHLQVTIVDALQKRVSFLQHIVRTLELEHVQCLHGRAEDLARQSELRDAFDLVTARAVARLAALNELCLPFVKKGGLFVSMKGSDPSDELQEAGNSLKQLRAETKAVFQFELPVEHSSRHLIVISKTGATPAKYPRKAGLPLKQPL